MQSPFAEAKMQKMPPLTAAFSVCRNYSPASSDEFSHCWFAIPQLVLQADWQDVWHSPHPPFFALSQRLRVLRVFIIFILSSLRPYRRTVLFVLIYSITKCAICQYFFAFDCVRALIALENARFRFGGPFFSVFRFMKNGVFSAPPRKRHPNADTVISGISALSS